MTAQTSTEPHPRKCDHCLIRHRALCNASDEEAIAELNRIGHVRSFAAGSTIITAGEPMPFVGNVRSQR
jgi:CRP/FNR family transcriptional regulator